MPAPSAAPPASPAPAPAPIDAPSKPDSSSSRPSVQPPPEKSPGDWMGDLGSELESMDSDTPKNVRKPSRSAEPPSPEDTKPADGVVPPEQPESPKPIDTPPEVDPTKMGARDLRKAYESSQKKIRDELQPKLAKLEAKVRELESAKPEENGAIAEKYRAIEKRNAELEEHIRFKDFAQSKEFKDKYETPYVEAWEKAISDVQQLTVELSDGSTRQATDQDIRTLATMPLGERITKAKEMFGDASQEVLAHVRDIRRLSDAQIKALDDAKKNSKTFAQEQDLKGREAQAERGKMWEQFNRELSDKYPAWFAPKEGDSEGNTLLNRGIALTKVLFESGKLSDQDVALLPKFARDDLEVHGKLSPSTLVRVHAIIRNKAANHDRLAREVKTLRTELADTKKSLAEFEKSEPGAGGGGGRRAASANGRPSDDYESELDEIDRRGR